MQILHFGFALGSFFAPLIARQFISKPSQGDFEGFANSTNNTVEVEDSLFYVAYWIASAIYLPTFLAYVFYAYKYDVLGCVNRRISSSKKYRKVNGSEDEVTTDEEGECKEVKTETRKYSPFFQYGVVSILGLFIFLYVGLEVSYGSWIFTAVVTGPLGLTKNKAAILQSVFWGTFAFTRLFSVVLSMLNVRSAAMIAANLFGTLVASLIMTVFPQNEIAIWIATAVLGMSYASIYPTVMTWMSETVEPTGMTTSIIVTGGTLGDISIPSVVGVLITKASPNILFYLMFIGVIVSASLFALAFFIDFFYKRHLAAKSNKPTINCNGHHKD